MTQRLIEMLKGFRRDEEGSSTIEFSIYFTVFFFILAATVEMGYMNLRHALLERGVDLATREIRLNTGVIPTYEEVRQKICDEAVIVDGCTENLRLEMVQVDPRNFTAIPLVADCINAEEDPRPVRNFVPGLDNQLMLLRACLKYKPAMPTTSFGMALPKDPQGYAQLVATSAFVQEPR
ncbi:pilus assembly protein [Mameliella sp. CS4]|uniref:TadE/TadG family type IV pilus assembly protein n=1 Tax=Mameliella sp. CS4 TaxID=2862329 RepID=UPI001C5FEF7A|nr:TadE/TadG family type IV pilus assembly protein [Mameliella sp. CS4]MBW4983664.1 pilus assembly protein [Mameliella sp. CS4]